ncbi:DUF2207 domain-containing protein [Mycetocola zhadangensis]|uniref:DUF2207 domain-containing protein n=1 Tax=Mycetocola zhadangensis TaxID=1164595 RepID=A0A3L7ISX8_9MICO|nr:DUF2207 domain-containing protein [Mycetocola zhadangensis]RLQ81348.1 DUF2207 domain-containing protein [Mycetocola zhadangensis]GGF02509.1 hypothetical protein GCM10011313_27000 [Mycetocola zhadangensis]
MTQQPETVSREFVRPLLARAAAFVAVLGVALMFGGMQAAPAIAGELRTGIRSDVSDFTFSSFEGEYTLGRDADGNSTLRVVETFVAEFPEFDQNKGIVRAIPEGYQGVNLRTEIVSVTDGNGNPVAYDDGDTEDGFILLALGTDDYVRGTQTYVIEYTQKDAVRAFADTNVDEFHWDAPGTGWDQPFDEAQMRVVVPADLADALTGESACYVGQQGSDDQCDVATSREDGATVLSSPNSELGPRENYSMAIAFEKGTFVTPEIPSTWPIFTVVPAGIAVLSVGTLAAALLLRRRSTADAPGRGIIVPQYTVPRGLDIFVAADLIGRTTQAMPALLISLAVRHNLRIVDDGESTSFLSSKREYRLQYLSDAGASAADLEVLEALFGARRQPGAIKDLSATDTALAKEVQALVAAAPQASVKAGFRVKKIVSGRGPLVAVAAAVAVAMIGLLIAAAVLYGINAWVTIALVVVMIASICTFVVVTSRNALTPSGAEVREYLLGLRDYLALAEADRIAMLQSPTGAQRVNVENPVDPGDSVTMVKFYEKLLPFAVLWGVDEQWATELARYYQQSASDPDWYSSRSGFNPVAFSAGVGAFSTSSGSSTPWSASATSSSSGGSGGGGFSGGGGGGGGGGGR